MVCVTATRRAAHVPETVASALNAVTVSATDSKLVRVALMTAGTVQHCTTRSVCILWRDQVKHLFQSRLPSLFQFL
jgi:hypothetical protein